MARVRRFNLAEDNILLARRKAGESWVKIAKYLERHECSVQARHRHLTDPIHTSTSVVSSRAMRRCLGPLCAGLDKDFMSDHPGNRICPNCAKSDPLQSNSLG